MFFLVLEVLVSLWLIALLGAAIIWLVVQPFIALNLWLERRATLKERGPPVPRPPRPASNPLSKAALGDVLGDLFPPPRYAEGTMDAILERAYAKQGLKYEPRDR